MSEFKKDSIISAKDPSDGDFYKAKLLGKTKSGKYKVDFIDDNGEVVEEGIIVEEIKALEADDDELIDDEKEDKDDLLEGLESIDAILNEDEEDEKPADKKSKAPAKKPAVEDDDDLVEEESEVKKPKSAEKSKPTSKKPAPDEEDEDEVPANKPSKPAKPAKPASDDDSEVTEDWYAKGDSEDAKFVDARSKGKKFRFWLPQGKKTSITILNSEPFTVREHQVKMNGTWNNFYTCIAPSGQPCAICETGNKAKKLKVFYIIDHTEYEDSKGETKKDQIRTMAMTESSYKSLKEQVVEYFSEDPSTFTFQGLRVVVKRTDADKSPNTGDVFIVKEISKIGKINKDEYSVEKFKKEFAPLSRKELASLYNFMDDES